VCAQCVQSEEEGEEGQGGRGAEGMRRSEEWSGSGEWEWGVEVLPGWGRKGMGKGKGKGKAPVMVWGVEGAEGAVFCTELRTFPFCRCAPVPGSRLLPLGPSFPF
jgi:hypothetical protein